MTSLEDLPEVWLEFYGDYLGRVEILTQSEQFQLWYYFFKLQHEKYLKKRGHSGHRKGLQRYQRQEVEMKCCN